MKKIYRYLTAIVLTVTSTTAFSQIRPCATDEAMKHVMQNHPEVKTRLDAINAEAEKLDKEAYKNGYKAVASANPILNKINAAASVEYTVPVVFHILHTNGPENISNAQCEDGVKIMNLNYAKQNADTSVTVAAFKGIASAVGIHFVLATIDPDGNCTNGIVRHYDTNTNWTENNWGAYAYTWDPRKYLNVYVVKNIAASGGFSAAAYTYLPGTFQAGAAYDCIVSIHSYVGSIGTSTPYTSNTLAHEAGHWFNLQHPWGNNNGAGQVCGDDGVTDTPETAGSDLVCNTSLSNCNPPVIENVQNFMDYSYCSTMFTAGQATRMRNTIINNTGNVGRPTVVSSANLTATGVTTPQVCVPVANFHASQLIACPSAVITFQDSSANAIVTGWHWSFPGAAFVSGSSATDSMPKVTYATPGQYAVSYTASTSAGGNAITKTSYITINSNVAAHNTSYTEGFESTTLPGTDWSISHDSTSGIDWAVTANTSASGLKCAMIDNFNNEAGNVSILQSDGYNLAAFGSPAVTFKMAYQQQATTNNDKLQVFVSTDCGYTWISRLARSGTTLANVSGTSTSPFTPTAIQFTTYTVTLTSAMKASSNALFRWVFSAGTSVGNNLYVDDINIYDAATGIQNIETQVGLNVYPNPSAGKVNIDFNLSEKHTIAVNVTDMLGRSVEVIALQSYQTGESTIAIGSKAAYQAGVYLVNIDVDGQRISKKILIQ